MKLRKHILLIVLLTIVKLASAQYTTAHYIAPSPWSYFSRYNELVVTTLSTTPVAVTIASSNGTIYSNSLTTVAGTPLRYRFSATNASYNASSTILTGQGLYVSASVPIGVQVRNIASDNYTYGGLGPGDLTSCVQKGNSAFTSLGDQGLGTSFRLGYYANVTGQTCYSGETGAPLYSVLAISNSTNVYVNGVLLKTLSAGQSYIFQASLGSILTANNNVAVNSGMRGDNSSGCADGVESQVIPISNLGTTYVVVRSNGNTGYEKSTIVATQASTTVTVKVPSTNTTNTYTLSNAGDYVTINNGDGATAYTTSYITTTAPVAVYTGSADGCEIDMIVQPPLSSCSGSFDVQTSQFLSNTNDGNAVLPYFGYIVIQSDTAIVYFNGTNLESIVGNRTQIGTSGFYIIKYTSTQLGNPSNLRFVVNARINAALIESGAGYSMSAFISSISNAMPPPSASSGCLPTTFTAQGGFSSYQWYKDGVAVSGATSQTYSPSVAGSYSVTGTTANCGTTAQSTAVLVNPKPSAGSDAVSCAGKDVTLTATSTITGGSWLQQASNPTGATLSNTANNVSTATFTNAASGIYKFIFSVGCSDTMSVTINPLPTVAAITGTTNVCIGSTTTLADATTGGVWSSATTSVATINSSGVVTGVSAGTSVISYTVTNANGCVTTVTTTVTVNALPIVAAITGTTNVCAGSTTTLADATTGGVWSSATTSVATVNSSGVVTGVSAGTSVISYTVTNANGCVTTVTTTITVNALPIVAAITGTTNVCAGSTTTLADATTGGVWSSATTSVATINSSGVVTGVSAGTSIISYTVTNANGCVSSVNTTITVNALPTVAAITGTTSICAGTSTTLADATAGGVWSSATTSVATINSSGIVTGVSAGSSVITYTYTNANGCSASTTKTFTVNAQPVVAAITGTSNVCIGSGTVTLANTTSGGTWSSSVTSVATISSSGVVTSVAPGTTTINYTVNGSGGCSTTQSFAFTVKSTSTSTTNASICSGTSYTFNGTVYSIAGTYIAHLTNAVGCDSAATLVLTVKSTSTSTTNVSICSGTTYTFNGTTYTTAGTYVAHLTNAVGCDSAATLVLTVKSTSTSTTNASICSGTSYTFNGTVYTTAGTYVAHLTNAVGCDSAATLNLTVKQTSASTTNISICSGTSYTFNGTTYTTAGTYVAHLTNTVGCDSAATLNLAVKATSTGTTNASICSGTSYTFNGTTYTTAGTYVAHLTNAVGCDSAATLVLTVKATSTSTTNISICPTGLPYVWNGLTFNAAGTYVAHLTNAVGCDSAATLNLTIKQTSTSTTNASICSGTSYTFNGTTYTTAGTYVAHLTNAVGCDSAATLNLVVKATSTSTTNTSICSGTSYTFNGTTYSTAGTYVAHLTNAVGCDSAATLNLTVKATSASTTNISICPTALPYVWNGLTFNAAGTQTAHLTNAVGCDSAATLVLAVKATSASTTNVSICPTGLPYLWNGLTFNAAGTQTAHLTNAVGCDSAATLVLTVKATSTSTTNASICSGTTYTFNGTTYSTAGTYVAHLTNAVGCDSAATLVLTIKQTSTSTTNASICSGTTYTFNGTTYSTAGTYVAHLTNAVGCDSAATLNLAVKATSASTTNISICPTALPYVWNGLTFNVSGTQIAHLTNAVGCDSAATLVLTVKAISTSTTNASICSGTSYTFNGTTYTTAGTYVAHLTNAVGCDSAATLNLTVKATSASTTNASICSGTTYTFNGTSYSTAGTYVAHLTNVVGCDSAATLMLTVKATSTSTTNISICPTALPYVWNGLTFNTAGTQTAHLTNAVGCDSAATLVLTVKGTSTSTTNISICSGTSYTFNGTTYTTAGTYVAHLTNTVGCDSAATLVLTVKSTSTSTTNASICSGTSYTFNGTTYSTAGTYVAHLTNAVGCDSAATLVLTVKATSTSNTNISICPTGLPYLWNGLTFNASGTQTAHLTNAVGCDSAATLVLTVKATSTSTTNASICSGTSYTFNGIVYSTAGTYIAHLTNAVGCDSAATLVLVVKATSTSTTNISICPTGLPYVWNGLTFNTAGTQTAHLTNAVGCDSAATLVLTVKATSTSTTNISICPTGLPYLWNGLTFNASGTQTAHLTNAVGCDSAATLVLTVKATSASTTNASICSGTSYTFNGTTYTTAGTYVAHLTNAVGCDSAATLVLAVKATSASTTNISICPTALPYVWNGLTFNVSGTQIAHLTNAVGCDSAATLVLTVKATSTSTTNISICSGTSYTFNGTTYTTAGTYVAHLTNAVGCDSAATLNLVVKATSTSTTNTSICSGTSYTFNGTTYSTAGTYVAHLTNAVGCDSAATLVLTVKSTSTSTTNISICPTGLPYVWNGLTFNAASTQTAHLTNAVGCDSAATLVLIVKSTSTSTTNASICSGTTYTFNGTVYTTAGTYVAHLINALGCDSAATLNLAVKATSTSTTNASICSGTSYTFNGTIYSTAGTYVAHLTNAVGCDSAATLNLTVKATSASTTNASICSGTSYTFNGTTYTTAGTYIAHLTNAVGCDSAATLNLTVKATSTSTTNASICSGSSYTFNGTTYSTAGTYVAHLTNSVGCDSAATLNLAVKATSTSTTNASICSGTTYTFNGTTYSTAGTYVAHLTNAVGCDSAATLVLTLKATSTSTTNASICSGTTYTFNGTTYSTAGTYVAHLTNAVGCDSAATLVLTVKSTSTSTTNASICSGTSYTFNGTTYTTAGTYVAHLTNAVGCDSAATLVLTVKATSTSTTNASICSGTSYTFNGTIYSTAGTYVAHLTNAVGCDSTAILHLTILYPSSSINSMSICPSALPFIWNGVTFTGAGTQTAHILNVAGCDSVATLILTVKAALTSTTNATICGGNSYMFNGTAYTTSGTYVAYLASGLGCDSIATLNLTVAPKPNAGTDKIIGFNNGAASVTLSGIGSGVWIEQTGNTGTSTIVSPADANTIVKNFSSVGTYNYIYVYGACTDTMKVAVNPNGNISSYVWVDTNEDGINNESSTNGINNVTVELYKDDGTGNFILAQTTVTTTNNGMPGYYNFIIPETGNYKVKFPLVVQDGGLTTQNLSTNYSKTSVADPATGFSPVVTINTTGSGNALNNTSVGAGYKYVAAPNCNMTANIGYNQLSQCVTNNQYNFTGNFTGGTAPFTYLWDLNDGTYANTNNVSHTYATAGEHDVTFIVKDSRGCEAHASTVQIYIGAKPKASLDIYTHSGNGDGFTFVSTSTISGGWMNYAWDLGNGTTSTLVNPMTTYAPGTYTITFIATGNFGCSDTLTKVITVDSNNNYCSAPIAKFTVNATSQCLVGNAFTFTNNSTGTPTNYTWNFGDGSAVVTTQNATYGYASSGIYNVALTIANACGSNTVTKQITVNDLPSTPTAITGPSTVTIGSIMLLSNATTGGVWSSSNTAVAIINSLGIVTGVSVGTTNITYNVSNACGTSSVSLPITVTPIAAACTIPVANFTINNATQCLAGNAFVFANNSTGTTLNYTWNFGDASGLVNAIAANHTYTSAGIYTVSLTASNNCGISTITKTVIVNTIPAQPVAITGVTAIVSGATSTLSSVTTGGVWLSSNTAVATVNANGLVTAIAAGTTVITYTVSNTCGTASVTKAITVTAACVPTTSTTSASICAGSTYSFNGSLYNTAGTYTVHLTNAAGCDSAAILILTIKQPTASTTTASICAGSSYSFNGSSYNSAGTYTVHLTNAAGCDSAATLILTINNLPVQPQVITGNTNLVTGTTSALSSATVGGIWSSNNTVVATVNANGLVTAVSTGTAVITYTVSNGCGSASVTTNVTVTSAVIPCNVNANFTVNNLQQCVTNNQFVFTNTTTGGTAPFTYLWNLSDGTTAITKDVTKIFATYGEHDIALQVTDSKGCVSNAASQHVIVGAKPVANFTVLSNTGNGQSKTFISASTIAAGSINYAWDFGNGSTSTLVNPTVTFVQGSYTVKLVVSGIGSCKDSATQIIAEQGIASVSVYPNPVVNTVQVGFRAASITVTTVRVMDLQGRILQTQTVMPASVGANVLATLDFSALQPGSYVIYISDVTNGFLATKTILKQ